MTGARKMSSNHVGPIVFADDTDREQLVEEGVVKDTGKKYEWVDNDE